MTYFPLTSRVIGFKNVDFNSTADQPIVLSIPSEAFWIPRRIIALNASAPPTIAQGGVYLGAGKTTPIVGAGQLYTTLTSGGKYLDLTLTGVALDEYTQATSIYFSLTTAEGVALTGRIWVIADLIGKLI